MTNQSAAQQDSIRIPKREISRSFGFHVSLLYSNMSFDSDAYFADSSGKVGRSHIENTAGISFGVSYKFRLNRSFIFRPGVEGVILPVMIKYDSEVDYQTGSNVWPGTFEFPFHLIFSRYERGVLAADYRKWPEIGIGLRPVIPIGKLTNLHPTLKTFNLNIEGSIGVPFKMKFNTARLELFYSHGLNNIMGTDELDYKTYTVNYLGRSYFGIRMVFN